MFRPFVRSCCFLSLLGFVFLALPVSYAAAQSTGAAWTVSGGGSVLYSYPDGQVPWDIGSECPFEGANGVNLYEDADKDNDGCPYAVGAVTVGSGTARKHLAGCASFYESLNTNMTVVPGTATPPHPGALKRNFCADAVETRARKARQLMRAIANKSEATRLSMQSNTVVPGVTNSEQAKEITTKVEEKRKADLQCFNDSLEQVGKYWAKQQQVACVRSIRAQIKQMKFEHEQAIKASKSEQDVTGGSSGMSITVLGTGVDIPSIWGALQSAIKSVTFNAQSMLRLANAIADVLNFLTEGCDDLNGKLNDIMSFRNTLGNLCQAAENLMIRQLTQCVRTSLTIDYTLPRFQVLLQCPVNINTYLRVRPGSIQKGFTCFTQNPLTGSGASALSGDGGLRKLFDGSCFERPPAGGGAGSADDRVPGSDCGPLSDAGIRKQKVQGQEFLTAGPVVENGWSAGGSETVDVGRIPQMFTRCDYYMNGRRVKTSYVYGSGASCNTGSSGFLDNGFETNTACYPSGGYTPMDVPNIPAACLYPSDCLDNRGNFSESLLGTGNCPANANPVFNPEAEYKVTSGGVGGSTETRSCSEFDPAAEEEITCCDPQMQNCLQAENICQCDNGDPLDQLQPRDPNITNPPYPLACQSGASETCCSPRLHAIERMENGRPVKDDGCDIVIPRAISQGNAFTLRKCPDEIRQCLYPGETLEYDLPSTTGTPVKARVAAQNIVTLAKPSPYTYLFIQPDIEVSIIEEGRERYQGCCVTPWCNVCPQHYANAYALSLNRSVPPAVLSMESNNNILGTGWPYDIREVDDEAEDDSGDGALRYLIPVTAADPMRFRVRKGVWVDLHAGNIPNLHLSNNMEYKFTPEHLAACNNLVQPDGREVPKAVYISGDHFQDSRNAKSSEMGFYGSSGSWVYSPIPMIGEMPMDVLNRRIMAQGVDVEGLPPLEIRLCSEVIQLCEIDPSMSSPDGLGDTISGDALTPTGGGGGGSGGGGSGGGGSGGGGSGGGGSGGGGSGGGQPSCVNLPDGSGYICYDANGNVIGGTGYGSGTGSPSPTPVPTPMPSAPQPQQAPTSNAPAHWQSF